jgi:UDP-glucose 6-dehydrogenase
MDERISTYGAAMHGKPFGGFCLPKDLDSIIATAQELSLQPLLLESVREVNDNISDTPAVAAPNGHRILAYPRNNVAS